MDQRERESYRRNRPSGDITYKTISLTLADKLLIRIKKEVKKTEDRNTSRFVEELVSQYQISEMPVRRKFRLFPVKKKTFTFTEDFVKKIKKSGNMSLFVEKVLTEKFDLK